MKLRFGFALLFRHEETLINKRGADENHGYTHERSNSIERTEVVQIVEEELRQRDQKKGHARVAHPAGFLFHAGKKQGKGKERPGDRIGHVAGEIAREGKGERRADGKIVGDLDVEEEEGEDRA